MAPDIKGWTQEQLEAGEYVPHLTRAPKQKVTLLFMEYKTILLRLSVCRDRR